MKEERYFYVPNASDKSELPEEEAKHALKVLRLNVGDKIVLIDGNGSFYSATVSMVGNKHCWYEINEEIPQAKEWKGNLMKKLELPYHILKLCGGDMSFTSSICYDFEVWSAAQKRWLEVSSVSNFESYQANRLKCRYRHADDKKIELCHTLNGSALALPRIVAAIIENNQTPDGIRVPRCLIPYCGFDMLDDKNF